MRKASLLFALLVALLFALAAYPQQIRALSEDPVEDPDPGGDQTRHPNVAKGIDPEKAVVGDLDSINLFNGNLTVSVPIGQRYPLSTRLSYQLTLSYNSTVWDFEAVTRNNIEYTAAYPDRRANAGFGWSLSLGRLFKPQAVTNETGGWVYEGPDGTDHRFFESLHLDEPYEAGIGYTRDGSYLRRREVDGMQWVEFPDGSVHEFEPDGNNGWRLKTIRDQFGAWDPTLQKTVYKNRLDVTYEANASGTVDWVLDDTTGRQHRVRFILLLVDGANVPAVDEVELAGPEGIVLTYDFTYAQAATVRPCADTDNPTYGGTAADAVVQKLTRVEKPDGSDFDFTYHIVAAPGSTCFGGNNSWNGGRGTNDKSGVLTGAALPTGGSIAWSYGEYLLPVHGPATHEISIQYVWGVHSRAVTDPARNTTAQWQYTPALDTDVVDLSTDPPNVLINTEIDPANNTTLHYFNVQREKSASYGTDYGLGFSPIHPDPGDNTRFLSRAEYAGQGATRSLVRKHYVRYEHDAGIAYVADPKNRRLASTKTVHDVNDYAWSATTFSGFDGLGHYRTAKTDGNFGSGDVRETYTDYNLARGTYPPPAGQAYSRFPSGDPWVIETFSETKKTEGTSVVRKQYCFDSATGAVTRERALAGAAPGASDLLSVYVLDGDGNAVRHDSYGGDGAALDTNASLCAVSLPSMPKFRTVTEYQYGVRKSMRYHHPSGGEPDTTTALPFKSFDITVDQNTGMVTRKRDTAGRETIYSYDASGRVESVDPPGAEVATNFTYTNASSSSGTFFPSSVKTSRGSNDFEISSVRQLDGLGRPWREKTLMPDGTWSVRETQLNSSGWVTGVSESERLVYAITQTEFDFQPSHLTEFSNFDPFGRARKIETPDGSISNVSFIGIRQATRTRSVATGSTEAPVSTIEDYDRQGRLRKVTENSTGTAAKQVTTTYTYDAADRLRSVEMKGHDKNGNNYTQPSRTFTYDGRGLLASEWHPESNTTSYEYDAAGNMTKRTDGVRELKFAYDDAGRLVTVTETGVGLIKELFYDRPNASTDYSNGKLDRAVRHNRQAYLGGGDVTVTEKYFYTGTGGRLGRKETTVSTGERFTDSYAYESLGLLAAVGMPKCTTCSSLSQADRVISNTYKHGLLSSVLGLASPIDYHPNGLLKRVRHLNEDGTNGPMYEQLIDETNGMARPKEILVRNSCAAVTPSQSPSGGTINSGQSFDLTFSVPGATSYKWYARTTGSDFEVGQTTSTITVNPTVTTTYWARATVGACTVDSTTAVVTVVQCPSPSPTITTVPSINAAEVKSASVTVASGVTVTSYQWIMDDPNAAEFVGSTTGATVSYRAKCSGTVQLRVVVTTGCTSAQATKQVPITPVSVSLSAQPLTINQGSSTTLTATVTGTGFWNVVWSDNLQPVNDEPSPISRSASPVRKTTYTATATAVGTSGCSDVSNSVIVNVTPPAPTNVVATAVSSTSVNVTWSFSGTADTYEILRWDRAPGSPAGYRVVGTSTTKSFTNTAVPTGTACLYRVRAIVSNTASADSGYDLATTTMFTNPVLPGTYMEDVDVLELRTAVNAVRTLANLTGQSFTDMPIADLWLRNVHIQELRNALDAARTALVLPAAGYSDQPLDAGDFIKAAHIHELREGVK